MPCNDALAAPVSETAAHILQQQVHHDHHDDLDDCSPFCTCSCCAGFVMPIAQDIGVFTAAHYFEKACCAIIPSALPEVFLPIWQPPQLV